MRNAALAVLLLSAFSLSATDRVEPRYVAGEIGAQSHAPAPRLAAATDALLTLAPATEAVPEELASLRAWNAAGNTPAKVGFTRSIGSPLQVRVASGISALGASAGTVTKTSRGSLVWSGAVRVAGAARFRIHLRNVVVPAGTTFWAYGTDGRETAFGAELIDEQRNLYVPSVWGEVAYLEMEVPSGQTGTFEIADILELTGGTAPVQSDDASTCLVDSSCVATSTFDAIGAAHKAVAYLEYVKGTDGYVCSGGLLNDRGNTGTPYFLTANHCFSTQASATSLETYWDYQTASCNGSFPALNTLQRRVGSTLLATSAASDFTLVRLSGIPSNRFFLGWDSRSSVITSGTLLHRVSHPFPDDFQVPAPQFYSRASVTTTSSTCTGRTRPNYIYSNNVQGGTYGGSSGSPVILTGGYVVGQLFGACGQNPAAGCDNTNYKVDGAFSATFPQIAQYIDATTGGGTCTPNATTACMLNNRFKVTVKYRAGFDTQPPDTNASLKSVSGFANASFESAFFYFNSESNIEMLVKVLDQGNTNNQGQPTIAVIFATATPLGVELTVTDMTNNAVKTYKSNFASMAGATDFTAFVK
jgi:lysyl endopeptidase